MNGQFKAFVLLILLVAAVVVIWMGFAGWFGCVTIELIQVGPDHWPGGKATSQPTSVFDELDKEFDYGRPETGDQNH